MPQCFGPDPERIHSKVECVVDTTSLCDRNLVRNLVQPKSFHAPGKTTSPMSQNKTSLPVGSSGQGVRKLVIKPFKVQPKLPENFFQETWAKLQSALHAVYSKNASSISKEELYRAVEDLCVQKFPVQLYENLNREIEAVSRQKVNLLRASSSLDASAFLAHVETIWLDHCEQLSTIRNIFLYLDRSFALTSSLRGIIDLGNGYFRSELEQLHAGAGEGAVQSGGLVHRIVASSLQILHEMRQGDLSQRDTLGAVCRMLATLDLYASRFEPALVAESRQFFVDEGSRMVSSLSVPQFLLLVDRRLSETMDWTLRYLDGSSRRPLLQSVEQDLLAPHVPVLLEGLAALIDDAQLADLKRLARLLALLGRSDALRQAFLGYIKAVGGRLVQQLEAAPSSSSGVATAKDKEARDLRFIDDVLDFQEKMERVVEEAFKGARSGTVASDAPVPTSNGVAARVSGAAAASTDVFRATLKNGFEHFLNQQPRQVAEQLARYVDRKLRGEQGVSETDAEAALSRAMLVFKFLAEKDVFEAFYKKFLAKRLLLEKSASSELERAMLSQLKAECGAQFTSKLEGMFADLDLSAQCLALFRESASSSTDARQLSGDAFQLWLLTQGHWPQAQSPSDDTLRLPLELQPLQRSFASFYESHFQGRRLLWSHSLSRAVVAASFSPPGGGKPRVYDLDVTLFQAVALRCFSDAPDAQLTVAQVAQQTGLAPEEAKLCLLSFAAPLFPLPKPAGGGSSGANKLLLRHGAADALAFSVNPQFESRLRRMKVPLPTAVRDAATGQTTTAGGSAAAQDESAQTLEEVFRERVYQCDAAIVRIMKARKRLQHNQLMAEVMQQLRFPAQNADIKKRIEALMERDYLERDPDDISFYKYLA